MGLYKKSRDPSVATTYGASASTIATTISSLYDGTYAVDSTNGSSFYIPLSLICTSIGGMETFLPLRNVGNFELTLFLEDPSVCFYNPFSGSMTNANYTLSDLSLEVDSVQLNSSIVQLYDRLFRRAQKESVVLQLEDNVLKDVFVVFQPDFKNPFVCHGFMHIKINGIEQSCEFELDKRKNEDLMDILKRNAFQLLLNDKNIRHKILQAANDNVFVNTWFKDF